MLKKITDGIAAGILIAAGGSVFLACENKIAGAVLFSVALICICFRGYSLFTGKVCYLLKDHSSPAFGTLLFGLCGNAIATLLSGLALGYANPVIGKAAKDVCEAKLSGQSIPQTLIRAIFCGVMIYLSVEIFKQKGTTIGILFCIPTFILSGFEHSIADMFYFSAAKSFSLPTLVFLLTVLAGNAVGGLLLPFLESIQPKGQPKK